MFGCYLFLETTNNKKISKPHTFGSYYQILDLDFFSYLILKIGKILKYYTKWNL